MLKSYAGEKIMHIMKKTVAEFVSADSIILHGLLFLDLPLVISDGVLDWP